MRGLFFYTGVAGFAMGILLQTLWTIGLPETVWALLVAVVVVLVWRRNREAIAAPYVCAFGIFLFTFALGLLRVDYTETQPTNQQFVRQVGSEVSLEGVVMREPERRESSTHLYITADEETILVFADRTTPIAYGDQVELTGTLARPDAFETDLGRTFNYAGYLLARDVEFVMRWAEVEVVATDQGNLLLAALFAFKAAFLDSVAAIIPEPQAGLGDGLLLGVKSALGEDLETAFRKTGIIHIVVLSGYNVMIVAEAIMRLLSAVLLPRARMVVGILAITAFAILVGLGATVVRASIMAALVLVARATGNTYGVLRALMFAAVVMLVLNPYLLVYDPGFQLSFLASLGLILVAPHIEALLGFAPTTLQIREFITATISTQIFVLPLLLYSIGEFSVVSVIVNVLVLPVVPLAMLLVFLSGMVGFLSTQLALPLAFLANIVLSYIILTAEWFATLPFAAYVVPPFPFWVVVVSYAVMGVYLWWHGARNRTTESAGWAIEPAPNKKTSAPGVGATAGDVPVFFR